MAAAESLDIGFEPDEIGHGRSLLAPADCADLRQRWAELSGLFARSPREAVAAADVLVTDALQTLSRRLMYTRAVLDTQWSHGREPRPEDLRAARDLYRLLLRRLLG